MALGSFRLGMFEVGPETTEPQEAGWTVDGDLCKIQLAGKVIPHMASGPVFEKLKR